MTSSLRERAAAATQPTDAPAGPADQQPTLDPTPELEAPEYTDPIIDVDQVQAHIAWARVMRDVKALARSQTAKIAGRDGKGGYQYQFRGIDLVLNTVGPALRRHGVIVMPHKVSTSYGRANSGAMRECTVTVQYRIYGPKGDYIEAESVGEGLDTSDKATPKALTMAYRMLLINALTIPTQDPSLDADNSSLQRTESPAPKAQDYANEVADPRTSFGRIKQLRGEITQFNLGSVIVTNETGDDEQLHAMVVRIGLERRDAEAGR